MQGHSALLPLINKNIYSKNDVWSFAWMKCGNTQQTFYQLLGVCLRGWLVVVFPLHPPATDRVELLKCFHRVLWTSHTDDTLRVSLIQFWECAVITDEFISAASPPSPLYLTRWVGSASCQMPPLDFQRKLRCLQRPRALWTVSLRWETHPFRPCGKPASDDQHSTR